jgi:hypothetical protein
LQSDSRAQQILAPLSDCVGTSSVADREAVIGQLEQIAAGKEGFYEIQRRRKVARLVEGLRRDRLERPQLVVEAPTAVVNQEFENLPAGVRVEPPDGLRWSSRSHNRRSKSCSPSPWPSATISTALRATADRRTVGVSGWQQFECPRGYLWPARHATEGG